MSATHSIKSGYGQRISTKLNRHWNLLWEQRVVRSNRTAPTKSYNPISSSSVCNAWVVAFFCLCCVKRGECMEEMCGDPTEEK